MSATKHIKAKAGRRQDKRSPNPKAVSANPKKHLVALINIPLSRYFVTVYVSIPFLLNRCMAFKIHIDLKYKKHTSKIDCRLEIWMDFYKI